MSYSITYDKQFIKVGDDLYVPMVLQGDNNVWEGDNRRRARDWYAAKWLTKGSLIATSKEMLAVVDAIRQSEIDRSRDDDDKYTDKRFGWFTSIAMAGRGCSGTTFGMFRGIVTDGIKKAVTVEELVKYNVDLMIDIYRYKDEDILKTGKEIKPRETITTTERLLSAIKEWTEYYGENDSRIYLTFDEMDMDRYRHRQKNERQRSKVRGVEYTHVSKFFALRVKDTATYYFIKNTRRGYTYSPFSTAGKAFIDEKSANQFHKKMRNRDRFEVVPIDLGTNTITIKKTRNIPLPLA